MWFRIRFPFFSGMRSGVYHASELCCASKSTGDMPWVSQREKQRQYCISLSFSWTYVSFTKRPFNNFEASIIPLCFFCLVLVWLCFLRNSSCETGFFSELGILMNNCIGFEWHWKISFFKVISLVFLVSGELYWILIMYFCYIGGSKLHMAQA